jgi:hypothetical protein
VIQCWVEEGGPLFGLLVTVISSDLNKSEKIHQDQLLGAFPWELPQRDPIRRNVLEEQQHWEIVGSPQVGTGTRGIQPTIPDFG